MRNPWLRLTLDAWRLGLESTSVIGLRTMMFATGAKGAQSEAAHMVAEKLTAGMHYQTLLLSGALGLTPEVATARTVAHFRRKVRANRRRLSRT